MRHTLIKSKVTSNWSYVNNGVILTLEKSFNRQLKKSIPTHIKSIIIHTDNLEEILRIYTDSKFEDFLSFLGDYKIEFYVNPLSILLISPYGDEEGNALKINSPHLGIKIILESIENKFKDVCVVWIDANISGLDYLFGTIKQFNFPIIAFSLLQTILKKNIQIISNTKVLSKKSLMIVGGPDVDRYDHKQFLDTGIIDLFILKDFKVLHEIISILQRGEDLLTRANQLSDICYLDKNGLLINTGSESKYNFTKSEKVYSKINYKTGKKIKHGIIGDKILSIDIGNQCKGKCIFCSIKINTVIPPEAKSVINEIIRRESEIDSITLESADIFANYTFFNDLLQRLYEIRDINKPIKVTARVDEIFHYEILAKMYDSNIRIISYGIESFNNKVLKNLKKETTREQNIRTLNETLKVGLIPGINLILFTPWDDVTSTLDTLSLTVGFLEKGAYTNIVPGLRVRYGTPLAEMKTITKSNTYSYPGMNRPLKVPYTTRILDPKLNEINKQFLKLLPNLLDKNSKYVTNSVPFYSLLVIKATLEAMEKNKIDCKDLNLRVNKLITAYVRQYG